MAKKSRRVTVYLFGGLGNQLFQYFAGLATAEAIGASLYLKPFAQAKTPFQNDELGISAFKTEGVLTSSVIPKTMQEVLLRRFMTLIGNTKFIDLSQFLGIIRDDDHFPDKVRNSKRRHFRLIGYFQDCKYVEHLQMLEKPSALNLNNPSRWFTDMCEQAYQCKPIVIHIRRGDYRNHAETIGVLDFNYFRNAMKLIPTNQESQFWIFSDSLDEAAKFVEFAKLPAERTKIVSAPKDSSSAESLLLMTHASGIVISNSTFSWWGAYLNKNAVVIVVPQKWFKNLTDPSNLILNNWTYSPSIWCR